MTISDSNLLPAKKAAAICFGDNHENSYRRFLRLLASKELASVRVGKAIYVKRTDLENWLGISGLPVGERSLRADRRPAAQETHNG